MSIENDSKRFWETSKPYFSDKGIKTSGNIILSDKEGLILKEIEVAREFNIHFQSITSSQGLFKWPDSSESLNEPDPIKSIVNKYKNHPSIRKIKSKYIIVKPFSFRPVTPKDVLDVISTLVDTKSSGGDIPLRNLKGNKIFPQVLCKLINNSLKTGAFPDPLKLEEITSIHNRKIHLKKIIIGQLVFYLRYQNSKKKLYTAKFIATSSSTSIHCFADSDRVMVLSIHFSDCYRHGKRSLMNQNMLGQF